MGSLTSVANAVTCMCILKIRSKCYQEFGASLTSGAIVKKNIGLKSEGNVRRVVNGKTRIRLRATSKGAGAAAGQQYELSLTAKNVDLVLEEVRPYLIADGGNVDVLSVDHGIITLQLQGACGSCPSSTTTMKMGIERVLKEKFGDAVKDIRQANEQVNETTVESVNSHLDILRPAIKNYGGEVDVLSIVGGDCTVRYKGPDTIGSGIKAAIKEKFPDISNVIFTS